MEITTTFHLRLWFPPISAEVLNLLSLWLGITDTGNETTKPRMNSPSKCQFNCILIATQKNYIWPDNGVQKQLNKFHP